MVFLEKIKNPEHDYTIFMAVSEAVGHDRRGNPIYRKDDSGKFVLDDKNNPIIWNDLPEIKIKEAKNKFIIIFNSFITTPKF